MTVLSIEEIFAQRARYVSIAQTWIGTPFHNNASVKGHGADCLGFIYGAAVEAGLIDKINLPNYSPQQNLHKDEETYLNGLKVYCDEVPEPPEREPLPGDLVIWRFGRIYFHTAIVESWPFILHCHSAARGVGRDDIEGLGYLNVIGQNVPERGHKRPRKFLVLKTWHNE